MTRSMFPLFESVCVARRAIQNAYFHEARFLRSFREHFGRNPAFTLWEGVDLSAAEFHLTYKLRILYSEEGTHCELLEYQNSLPRTLRLVYDNAISYPLKYRDRKALTRLAALKSGADDVLVVKNGAITDSSYCNILFWDGIGITTPIKPLLKGTCRARLLQEKKIAETTIRPEDLPGYRGFQLINAMNNLDHGRWLPIENILPSEPGLQ